MITTRDKVGYLADSIYKTMTGWKSVCPYCKSNIHSGKVVDQKYFFTKLVECPQCRILVRMPTDSVSASNEFYQDAYSQEYTTDCPPLEVLEKLMAENFVGADRDYSRYINFLRFLEVPADARVLDFGCSWGYGLYQFRKAGYRAEGFEVSLPRGRYGKEKMSLPIFSSVKDLQGKYDVIFSSHVLEHLPDFEEINFLYRNHLAPGGMFVAVTPNGSRDFLKANYWSYHQLWGKVHPVLLTDEFIKTNFADDLTYMDSWDSHNPKFIDDGHGRLNKFELVYVLKPTNHKQRENPYYDFVTSEQADSGK